MHIVYICIIEAHIYIVCSTSIVDCTSIVRRGHTGDAQGGRESVEPEVLCALVFTLKMVKKVRT